MRISDWSSDVCSSDLASVLALPDRLAQTLAERLALAGELGAQTDRKLAEAEAQLKRWAFHPNGTEGFAKAEVTVGGISTANLSSQTMMAKRVPGMYSVGQSGDADGRAIWRERGVHDG